MKQALKYFTLSAPHKKQVIFLMTLISALYLFNFHVNDIWTPNESFYAEAVREMFESGNFLEMFYNYEARYNKPPLTYWAMAASAAVFGLNEFSLRLPIVLMGIGSIWFTYLLGRRLYGDKGGLYAMVMMAFTVQLLAVKQYASPEIPLTFFFTATMYYFYRGYAEARSKYLLLSYCLLGLTVLTKGFPYYVVIGGIIGLFVLANGPIAWRRIRTDLKMLKLHWGIPIMLIIGLSWIIFMYLKEGQDFWEVYYRETFGRALTKKSNGPKPFFYLEVISWSIAPYSLAFLYALIRWIRDRANFKKILFPFCWFIVMLVIFTIAKGKIPTYMIQAHPALLLMIVPLLLHYQPGKGWKSVWLLSFLFPASLLIIVSAAVVYVLNLPYLLYLVPVLGIAAIIYWLKNADNPALKAVVPFWLMAGFLFCFSFYFPRMEQFRPYDEIGRVVTEELKIDKAIPIQIEKTLIHNIPYYTKRFAQRDMTKDSINALQGPVLALVRSENMEELEGFESVWKGLIYDFSSESQFFKFVMACANAENGDYSAFAEYQLMVRDLP
ncbi:MAG: glycosyltransferase family 39 protein [Roseivirga sp.]